MTYEAFLERKTHLGGEHGFAPRVMPQQAFDFQQYLIEWALKTAYYKQAVRNLQHAQREHKEGEIFTGPQLAAIAL